MSNSVINKEDLTNLFKEYFEDNAILGNDHKYHIDLHTDDSTQSYLNEGVLEDLVRKAKKQSDLAQSSIDDIANEILGEDISNYENYAISDFEHNFLATKGISSDLIDNDLDLYSEFFEFVDDNCIFDSDIDQYIDDHEVSLTVILDKGDHDHEYSSIPLLQDLNDEDVDLTDSQDEINNNGLTMLANSQGISTPDFIKYMKDPDLIPQDHSAKSKFLNSVYKELFNYDSSLNFAAVGLCFKTTIKNLVTLLSQQKLEEKCLNELEPESYQGNSYFTLDPKLTHCCLYDPINGGGPLGFEIELSDPVKIPLANALIDFFDGKSISSCYTVAQIAREDELNREYVQDVLKEQPCHLMNDDEIKKAEAKLLDYNRANSKFQGKGR
jgi:hypothetical protein